MRNKFDKHVKIIETDNDEDFTWKKLSQVEKRKTYFLFCKVVE